MAKGGDGASVVLAQESMELVFCPGMWLGHSQQSLKKPFYGCFDLSSVQAITIRAWRVVGAFIDLAKRACGAGG